MLLPANVVTFAFEAKVDDFKVARQQLIMDLYVLQKHRRALSIKDGPVFGTVLDNGSVQFYVMYWKENRMVRLSFLFTHRP